MFQVAVSFLEARAEGFHDFLKIRPSSLLMLYGRIYSSMASLMSRSIYKVLAERSSVSSSLIIWSLFKRSSTADLSVCNSFICLTYIIHIQD